MTRSFSSLRPEEVLSLAVEIERANTRRFRAMADAFRGYNDEIAGRFLELADEEVDHERYLLERYRARFGSDLPQVDESTVREVIESPDLDDGEHFVFDSLEPDGVFRLALRAEEQARSFYQRAAEAATEPDLIELYREMAALEDGHAGWLLERLNPPRTKENS